MIRPRDHDQANLLKLVSQEHYTAFSQSLLGIGQQQMQNINIIKLSRPG